MASPCFLDLPQYPQPYWPHGHYHRHLRGDPVALFAPTSLIIFMTYCSAAVEQAILCHLFFSMSKNILVTAFLAILILAHMGLAFASGALILVLGSEHTAALNTATATSVTCAATDIFIAIALSSRFWGFLSATDVIPSRDSFSRRFFLLSISSGVIVASNTLVMMALLLGQSAAFSFFFSCQGRVYSLTLLANFLVGIHFQRDNTTMDGSTTSRSHPRQYSSALTGVVFDVIDGYDTESAFHQSLNAPRRGTLGMRSKAKEAWTGESKIPPASSVEPVPYNYLPLSSARLDNQFLSWMIMECNVLSMEDKGGGGRAYAKKLDFRQNLGDIHFPLAVQPVDRASITPSTVMHIPDFRPESSLNPKSECGPAFSDEKAMPFKIMQSNIADGFECSTTMGNEIQPLFHSEIH
ncbi:hypothetical protein B0H19DRAFT_1084268 [Mycena capillaripes]|nr:hypothetical protein B0H19DRAFT_1084268 [Mycena capillaripes]